MSLITKLNRLTALRGVINSAPRIVRCISTSPKKSDTATVAPTAEKVNETVSTAATNKNWVYWGFDTRDKEGDTNHMHASFFFSVSLCLVGCGFIFFYQPDFLLQDWAQREAYLELRRREAAGLEPVDRNYIDPALMVLPSDEELGNTEIII